jgi:hypothetical protein
VSRKPYLRETRYVTALVVHVPRAEALIEGMRYDNCYPASEVEAHKIARMISGSDSAADHVIRLYRVARTDLPPTEARWQSFACTILDVRHPEATPITDEELSQVLVWKGVS